ncbi:hypothetical protein B566_EDAN014224 [Ephemera danica]|nr:hypothetical protein B566_EDAN014224 [Ephemera danica]
MTRSMLSLVLLALMVTGHVRAQCLQQSNLPLEGRTQLDHQALPNAQRAFSAEMLRQLGKRESTDDSTPGSNLFFSPYSTYMALLLAYFGAAGHTEAVLQKGLHLQDLPKDKIMEAYQMERFFQGTRAANGTPSYELSSANRLYFRERQPLRQCIQDLFREEIQKLDFENKSDEARQTINSWVSAQTKNRINDLLPSGTITPATNVVLVNAGYFKGLWQSQFQPERTKKAVFYMSSTKQTLVDMMRLKGNFNHAVSHALGAHLLELPYKSNEVSMVILLPPYLNDPDGGLQQLLNKLTPQALQEAMEPGSMAARAVEVAIPKFTVEHSIELQPADLTGFSDPEDNSTSRVWLDGAVHKARLEVDEKGSVAAAATALFSFRSSRPLEPEQFVCDHPFVYLIVDKLGGGTILFAGIYRNPREQ